MGVELPPAENAGGLFVEDSMSACQWPVAADGSDPKVTVDFVMAGHCGEPCRERSPYCEAHHRRAWRPRTSRRVELPPPIESTPHERAAAQSEPLAAFVRRRVAEGADRPRIWAEAAGRYPDIERRRGSFNTYFSKARAAAAAA